MGKSLAHFPWQDIEPDAELLFYEGLHGGYVGPEANVAQHVDLCVGVVPIINLEWIQKLHRDQKQRGYSQEVVVETILRRMPDYINHICSQFSRFSAYPRSTRQTPSWPPIYPAPTSPW